MTVAKLTVLQSCVFRFRLFFAFIEQSEAAIVTLRWIQDLDYNTLFEWMMSFSEMLYGTPVSFQQSRRLKTVVIALMKKTPSISKDLGGAHFHHSMVFFGSEVA